jgi:MFS family permease
MSRFGINSFEYNLFYSVYSLPNCVLPLFGGYLVDKIGIRIGIVLFSSLIAAG